MGLDNDGMSGHRSGSRDKLAHYLAAQTASRFRLRHRRHATYREWRLLLLAASLTLLGAGLWGMWQELRSAFDDSDAPAPIQATTPAGTVSSHGRISP